MQLLEEASSCWIQPDLRLLAPQLAMTSSQKIKIPCEVAPVPYIFNMPRASVRDRGDNRDSSSLSSDEESRVGTRDVTNAAVLSFWRHAVVSWLPSKGNRTTSAYNVDVKSNSASDARSDSDVCEVRSLTSKMILFYSQIII